MQNLIRVVASGVQNMAVVQDVDIELLNKLSRFKQYFYFQSVCFLM
jgi:hypothetical protein